MAHESQWSRIWVKTNEAKSPAPNRATPLSGATIRSRNGMRHPLCLTVGRCVRGAVAQIKSEIPEPNVQRAAAVALHFMHCNFARIHRTLRITPAMAAGVASHVWDLEEIVGLLDAADKKAA